MSELSLGVVLGLLCAVGSAFGANLSFLLKHRGAVAAPDVDVRRPLRTVADLFRSKWWTIGWIISVAAFLAHVGALTLLPLSLAQAVISGGFVLLAVIAERYFGFSLGRRQWVGVTLVACALALLGITARSHSGSHSDYSLAAMLLFVGGAVLFGLGLIYSHRLERARAQQGVLLGAAAGLGFGVSDAAVKAVSGNVAGGLPWIALALCAGIAAFFASARSLQVGEGVAVIAITSVAANMSAILAGVLVFGDPMGRDALEVAARTAGFVLVLTGAVLMPAPERAAGAIKDDGPAVGAAAA
jgi:drug/metabolite transporter (DMT)-like permease